MSADKLNALKILDYWFLMEFLNQPETIDFRNRIKAAKSKKTSCKEESQKLKSGFQDCIELGSGNDLLTAARTDSKATGLPFWGIFTVYLGLLKREDCIQRIAQNMDREDVRPEESTEEIAFAVMKFSKTGAYIHGSLSVSPLAWAMNKLPGGAADASRMISKTEYDKDIKAIEEQISHLFETVKEREETPDKKCTLNGVSFELLSEIENMICKTAVFKPGASYRSQKAVLFSLYETEAEADADAEEEATSLHFDFYSDDLALAADKLRNSSFSPEKEKILLDYLLGLYRYGDEKGAKPERVDIVKPESKDKLYQFMMKTLAAKKAPLGKWPSKYMPALMQQIAINLATDKKTALPVFSVNGPPGTGKTTLLKEIIVNNIVEKARLLAEYEDPDKAFDEHKFKNGLCADHSYNQYVKRYYRFNNEKINDYSILVASNNNTAVENITKELPLESKILEDLAPSEEMEGSNKAALEELSCLFTVSRSSGTLANFHQKAETEEPDIYFSRLATGLLNADAGEQDQKQAFGLISASLGKRANVEKVEKEVIAPLLQIMMKNETIKQRKQSYLAARSQFMAQLEVVQKLQKQQDAIAISLQEREKILKEVAEKEKRLKEQNNQQAGKISAIEQAISEQQGLSARLKREQAELEEQEKLIKKKISGTEEKVRDHQRKIDELTGRIRDLQNRPSVFVRIFKPGKYERMQADSEQASNMRDQYVRELSGMQAELAGSKTALRSLSGEIGRLNEKVSDADRMINRLQQQRNSAEAAVRSAEEALASGRKKAEKKETALKKEIDQYRKRGSYDKGFSLSRRFVGEVLSSEAEISTEAQIRNPWFSEHYNREREKLFLFALQVTKEFILGSRNCRSNLKHLDCLWTGSYGSGEAVKFIGDDLNECTYAAYETLFLLIPVVSSTFASVQRMFKHTPGENVIGTLIVDEAGQASPHMAVGALCRAGKAIIVGDPKQVEPVVTDDQDLLRQTYTEELFNLYKDKSNSVQRFADIINPYGTYLTNEQGAEEWVGCPLLVHRRCISPMYDIANEISYNGIMKQKTLPPKKEKTEAFIAAQSQWINVSGKEAGRKNHFVKEQGDIVVEMLETAFSKTDYPDVYIISPFTTVVSGIQTHIEKYVKKCMAACKESALTSNGGKLDIWMKNNIGTVHKFQGKEASEVIFLLGCDTSRNAFAAIRWVNNNIVNVAVTRAKYRIYMIGDIQAWKNSKCISRAKEIIDTYALEEIERELQKSDPDKKKLEELCQQIPTGKAFPVSYEKGEDGEDGEYLPSTGEVIAELNNSSVMDRELTADELERFGFHSIQEIKEFSSEIQGNLIWGMKLYLLLESAYKLTNTEMDAACCGILFCKAIEIRMQECFAESLKQHFPDYVMRVVPATQTEEEKLLYLKDAEPEEFTLGWYPAFIKKKKADLGMIMDQIGCAGYDKQWWDDFKSKLFICKDERNKCCHTKKFLWSGLDTLLETMFFTTEAKHKGTLDGLMFESKVGLLMRNDPIA